MSLEGTALRFIYTRCGIAEWNLCDEKWMSDDRVWIRVDVSLLSLIGY